MIPREKWGKIIRDSQDESLPAVIPRNVRIPLDIPVKRAVSIIGPRRSGKTYEMYFLMKEIGKKHGKDGILYVNFERPDIGNIISKDLVDMLDVFNELSPKTKQKWLFLDEIQNVSGWELFARSCLDKGLKLFISGSSSKLLSKEIATSMRGRSLTYKILPFSFKEFLMARGFEVKRYFSSSEKAGLLNLLDEYFKHGGYPEAVLYKEEREKILRDIFDTAIYKDVIERGKVRNIKAMKLLIAALISSNGFSVHKFYSFLKSQGIKIGKNVLYNYLEYLNDAFFIFLLRKFDYSYKRAEQSIPKAYCIDNGLLTINGIEDTWKLMENMVFIEMLRREWDISYYQSPAKEEVDFLVKEGKKVKKLFQVSYSLNNFMTKEREFKALVKASKELKCKNLNVITWNEEGTEKFMGKKINIVPIWRFLLE